MNNYRAFFLTGCSKHIIFDPNELPDGHLDQEYYVPITISGGVGPIVDLSYEIHPINSGLSLVFSEKSIIRDIYIITLPYKASLNHKGL